MTCLIHFHTMQNALSATTPYPPCTCVSEIRSITLYGPIRSIFLPRNTVKRPSESVFTFRSTNTTGETPVSKRGDKLYSLVKVTHPDGHYYYGVTKNLKAFRQNLVRSYSALKNSNGSPGSHRSSNALAQYAYITDYSPSKWRYAVLCTYVSKKDCQYYRNKYIVEGQDRHLCLNVYHNMIKED
jgi:hypothetical protein